MKKLSNFSIIIFVLAVFVLSLFTVKELKAVQLVDPNTSMQEVTCPDGHKVPRCAPPASYCVISDQKRCDE